MTGFKVVVKSWMLKKSSDGFDFMKRFNNDIPMPLMVMFTGGVMDETKGMVRMSLHGDIVERVTTTCMCCGRPLTNPVSQYFGVGPECGGHNYTHPFDTDEELYAAVRSYREKLVNTVWTGWIAKSAIKSINDNTDIQAELDDMPIEIDTDNIPVESKSESKPEKVESALVITGDVSKPVKCTDDFSVFITFKYSKAAVEAVKSLPSRFFDPDSKVWEIGYSELATLKSLLPEYKFIIAGEDIVPAKVTLPADYKFKTNPMKHQVEGIEYGLDHSRWLLADDQGLGKALALDTKVYTPTGYKLMRDVSVGDYVFAKDGTPTRVSATYEHHDVEMYRITFSDGVSVECCKDHLWKIHDVHGVKVVDTKWFTEKDQFGKTRLNNLYSEGYGYKYWIDRCSPVQFEYQQVPVQPYVLGALLGDGSLTSNSIGFTTADDEMVKKINANLRQGYVLSSSKSMDNMDYNIVGTKGKLNTIKQDLINLGLWKTNSHTKFVPDIYKYNSISVRTQVLQGLIDTDGCASSDNLLSFSTVSKHLCDDVRFLVESLGGIVSCSEKSCGYNGKITGVCYNLTLKFDSPQLYCTLTRKRKLLKDRHFKPRRKIVSIERIENADARCITVDNSESLYLIDHFVVTHNTKQIIDLAMIRKETQGFKHCLIVCGVNGLKWNWVEEIKKHSYFESGYILGQIRRKRSGKLVIGSSADKIADLDKLLAGDDTEFPYFLITNIESLRNATIAEKLKELCDVGIINMVAVDEIHRCFDYDSPVLTDKGIVTIGDIVTNHLCLNVASYNNGTIEYQPITGWFENPVMTPLMELTIQTSNGIKTIRCTPDHKFYTSNRGWVCAKDLSDSDDILEINC